MTSNLPKCSDCTKLFNLEVYTMNRTTALTKALRDAKVKHVCLAFDYENTAVIGSFEYGCEEFEPKKTSI